MRINILKSKCMMLKKKEYDWSRILSTILATTKTIVSSKNQQFARISYFKNFKDYTLEVSVVRYENFIYVQGVNKNVQLSLSTMFK